MNERLFDVSHIEEDTKLFRRPGWMCGVKTKLNYFSDQTKDSHFPFSGSVEMREMWLWIDNNGIFKLNLNLNAFTLFRFLIWITPNWIPFYILSQEIIYFCSVGTAVHKLCSHHHPLSKLLHMSNSSIYSLNWINKQKYVFLFELKTPTYSKWIFFLIHCLALLTVYVFLDTSSFKKVICISIVKKLNGPKHTTICETFLHVDFEWQLFRSFSFASTHHGETPYELGYRSIQQACEKPFSYAVDICKTDHPFGPPMHELHIAPWLQRLLLLLE